MTKRIWTARAVRDLGVTTDVRTAAEILNIGRSKAYELAQRDRFPVKLLRIGRRYVVPVQPLLQALLDEPGSDLGDGGAVASRPDPHR